MDVATSCNEKVRREGPGFFCGSMGAMDAVVASAEHFFAEQNIQNSKFRIRFSKDLSPSTYKPLEDVASMLIDEFYEIFQNPTQQCIETPTNLWLKPEPGGR